jgi:hypothetical protein
MQRKEIILLAVAAIALNAAPTWAQSVGGSQSERSGESQTPVPQGSRSAGSEDPSKAEKSRTGQSNKDTSIGGSQSKRAGESQTPLPEGSRSAGSDDPSKTGRGSRNMSQTSGTGGQQDIRQAQEALKNQGHDPGPIDGVMGPQTRQALRAFQSSNGLKQTGMLNAETKQKLNIEDGSTKGSRPMGEGSTKQQEPAPMGR